MYYELYLDSLFFMDFLMNLFLLYLVNKIHIGTVTFMRIILASLYGAVIYCTLFFLPGKWMILKITVGLLISGLGMSYIAFRCNTFSQFISSFALLIEMAFLEGGIFLLIRNQILHIHGEEQNFWQVILVGTISFWIAFHIISTYMKKKKPYCRVIFLLQDGKEFRVNALVDSGNLLIEPISGKPVSVLKDDILKKVFNGEIPEYYRVVPYSSIGKKNGYLKCFKIPRLWIEYQNQKIDVSDCFVASFEGNLSAGGLQMILNPEVIK